VSCNTLPSSSANKRLGTPKGTPCPSNTGIRTAASARLVAEFVRRIVPPARAAVALAFVSGDLGIRLANGEATVDAIEDKDEEDDARDTLLTKLSSATGKAAVLLYLLMVGIVSEIQCFGSL